MRSPAIQCGRRFVTAAGNDGTLSLSILGSRAFLSKPADVMMLMTTLAAVESALRRKPANDSCSLEQLREQGEF